MPYEPTHGFEPSQQLALNRAETPAEIARSIALKHFDDRTLLLELRARKRLARVEYQTIAPSHAVRTGYPFEHQLRSTFTELGYWLAKKHQEGWTSTGFKTENGNFVDFLDGGNGDGGDRKIYMPLNYVVGDLDKTAGPG